MTSLRPFQTFLWIICRINSDKTKLFWANIWMLFGDVVLKYYFLLIIIIIIVRKGWNILYCSVLKSLYTTINKTYSKIFWLILLIISQIIHDFVVNDLKPRVTWLGLSQITDYNTRPFIFRLSNFYIFCVKYLEIQSL